MRCAVSFNCIFILGPTAVGKTAIGVRVATALGGEILSADSRQVYKGLDIGSGKDLADFKIPADYALKLNPDLKDKIKDGFYNVPYHLIDVCTLEREYNLADFVADFYQAVSDCRKRGVMPVCVGGTGMYLDSIIRNYEMIPFTEDPSERAELEKLSYDQLKEILIREKEKLHNTTDFATKERIITAIMINRFNLSERYQELKKEIMAQRPEIEPLIIGTTFERSLVRQGIARRLKARLEEGLIEEVEGLHNDGASFERLESLGLEYRFVSQYLQGKIKTKEELFELLNLAIGQFAKRQETWFRSMEKKGVKINWLPRTPDVDTRFEAALQLISKN